MSPNSYLDFDLLIESSGTAFRAAVVSSPAGEASNSFTLPFTERDLDIFVLQVFRLTSRRSVRAITSPEMKDVRSFGGRLYEAVFAGPVSTCLLRSMDEADRTHRGLRVRLRLGTTPGLANIPWEFMYDSSSDGFLCLSSETPVVRYVDLPQRVEPLAAKAPLRMLCLISSPAGYPPLDVEREWAKLTEALGPIMDEGRLVIDRVATPSLEAIQRKLRRSAYHILHFVGHGAFDDEAKGVLLLEDLDGRGKPVSAEALGVLLHDHDSLRLVILNACEGARTASADPFAGAAQTLVRKGIPAVIAMQFEISDVAAITLASEFYAAVADGFPVDGALSEARKAIFTRVNAVEWATPVLYMRSPDGRIFEIEDQDERLATREMRRLIVEPTPEAEPASEAAGPEPQREAPIEVVETKRVEEPEAAPLPTAPRPEPRPAQPVRPRPAGDLWARHRAAIVGAVGAAAALAVALAFLLPRGATNGPRGPTGPQTSPGIGNLAFAQVPPLGIEGSGQGGMNRVIPSTTGSALVAVGTGGAVWLSDDAVNWSRKQVPNVEGGGSQSIFGVAEGGPGLVAVGGKKPAGGIESAAVWTSADGSNWEPVPSQDDLRWHKTSRMNRVAAVPGGFVAVGVRGDDAGLWVSADGKDWKYRATPGMRAHDDIRPQLRGVDVRSARIVVVGHENRVNEDGDVVSQHAAAWVSRDAGANWKKASMPMGSQEQSVVSVSSLGGLLVAVGFDGTPDDHDWAAWTSPDGRTWSLVPDLEKLRKPGDQALRGILAIEGLGFVAVGIDDQDAAILTSPDGVSWSLLTSPGGEGEQNVMSIIESSVGLVAVGHDNGGPGVWTARLPPR